MRLWEAYAFMAKILIKNGRVWDGERFLFADVLTDGEVIAALGRNIDQAADVVLDASGKTVSPGLVDTHVHMRGISSAKYGMQAEMACLPFGVTAAIDAGAEYGDRALLDSFLVKNAVFICTEIKGNRAVFSKTEALLKKYGDRVMGVKVYFDTTVSEAWDITPLREICDFALAKGLRVMVHCSHSPTPIREILNALNRGDILTHAFHGGQNNAAEDAFESMKQAQARGVVIDAGFAGHMHTDFAVLQRAIECGMLPDTISTDITRLSAYTRGGRYGMTVCMSLARHLGMTEEDLFKAVTSNPARVLGKADEWGFLRVGGAADLAVLEDAEEGFSFTDRAGNTVECQNGYRCILTVVNGQIVYKH